MSAGPIGLRVLLAPRNAALGSRSVNFAQLDRTAPPSKTGRLRSRDVSRGSGTGAPVSARTRSAPRTDSDRSATSGVGATARVTTNTSTESRAPTGVGRRRELHRFVRVCSFGRRWLYSNLRHFSTSTTTAELLFTVLFVRTAQCQPPRKLRRRRVTLLSRT